MSKYILKKKLISIGDMFCKITFHKLFFVYKLHVYLYG